MSDELDNRINELLALAALGELTEAEDAELDVALAGDAGLFGELDADLAVAAALQATLGEDPPPSLKSGVMAAIDALESSAETDGVAVHQPASTSFGAPAVPTTPAPLQQPDVNDLAAQRAKRRSSRWQTLATAAAVSMLLVGGVIVANLGSDDPSTSDAIAEADDAQQRTLDGDLDGTLDVVYSPSQDAFVLIGTDIATLNDAQTYQLWFVDDDGAQPIGLFRPDDDGRVEQVFEDLDPSDFVVGVTVEPAGGSVAPTLPIIAAA